MCSKALDLTMPRGNDTYKAAAQRPISQQTEQTRARKSYCILSFLYSADRRKEPILIALQLHYIMEPSVTAQTAPPRLTLTCPPACQQTL